MRYIILEKASADVLSKEVNLYIEKGWLPQGGVSTYFNNARTDYANHNGGMTRFNPVIIFIQSMIKHKKEKIF